MVQIYESSFQEMDVCISNKANTVIDLLAINSRQSLYNSLLSFFSEKKIEKEEMKFDLLSKKILKWVMANYENDIHLLFYVNSKIAHDDIFMSNLSVAINNAIIMAFCQLNRGLAPSGLIDKLSGIGGGIFFHFVKSPRRAK